MALDGAYINTPETFGIDPLLKGLENDPLFYPPSSVGYEPEDKLPQDSGFDKELVSNPNLYSTGTPSEELETSTTYIVGDDAEALTVEADVDLLTKEPLKEDASARPDEADPLLNPGASAALEEKVASETAVDTEGLDEENESSVEETGGGESKEEIISSLPSGGENGLTDEGDDNPNNNSLSLTSKTDEATEEEAEVTTDDTANSTDATVTEETDEMVGDDSLSQTTNHSDIEGGDNTASVTGETDEDADIATDDAANLETEADKITATDETVVDQVVQEKTTNGDVDDALAVSDQEERDHTENAVTEDENISFELTPANDTTGEDNNVGVTEEIAEGRDDETETDVTGETEDNTGEDAATEESDLVANTEFANLKPKFESGTFKVGETGEVEVDFIFDGGAYRGQVAIVSLSGMEGLDPTSREFFLESISRAASNSELGYMVIDDNIEGAIFSGRLGEHNYNSGEYQGVKSFLMRPGDEFFLILVPNGTLQQVLNNPNAGGALRPLFSLATANPNDGYHFGQIADITGDGSAFAWEDIRIDGGSDQDYNDIILQFRGATGKAPLMDDVVAAGKDWRGSDLGKKLINYVKESITPEEGTNEEDTIANESDELSDESNDAVDVPTDEATEDETEGGNSSTDAVDDSKESTGAIAEDDETEGGNSSTDAVEGSDESTEAIAEDDETEGGNSSTDAVEGSDESTEAIAQESESEEPTDNIADDTEEVDESTEAIADDMEEADEATEAIADEEESDSPSNDTNEVVDETIDEADNETEIVGDATDEVDETEVVEDDTDTADESDEPTDNIEDEIESDEPTDNIENEIESDEPTDNIADDIEDSENQTDNIADETEETSPLPSAPTQPRFEFPQKDQPQIIVIRHLQKL